MKLGLSAARSAPSPHTQPLAIDRIDRFVDGEVILIDTDAARFTFIIGDGSTSAGTLAGGHLYDPVAALLVGSLSDNRGEATPGLRVGGTALFFMTSDEIRCLHRVGVLGLSRIRDRGDPGYEERR
ncbi:MAG TPA: hypothetical protein VLT33_48970 [Labilithrix sp.]|nr:hypothetical protein [Labilithrix sp.]